MSIGALIERRLAEMVQGWGERERERLEALLLHGAPGGCYPGLFGGSAQRPPPPSTMTRQRRRADARRADRSPR